MDLKTIYASTIDYIPYRVSITKDYLEYIEDARVGSKVGGDAWVDIQTYNFIKQTNEGNYLIVNKDTQKLLISSNTGRHIILNLPLKDLDRIYLTPFFKSNIHKYLKYLSEWDFQLINDYVLLNAISKRDIL